MASSFADDFNKRKKAKEKLSKGDYSLDTSSSNTFEETVKEAAPPALKKSGSSSGSSSKKKSTTVKSTKSTVGDTVKKATSGSNSSKVKKQYIDDPDHENGTPVEDDDDRDRDEVSIFDEADEVKKDDDKESVSFAPKFSGTASVFSDIAKSAFPGPGNDDEDDGSVFSARSKVKSRHESAEEIKKDPSKLYKQNEKNSAFYNDFQRRKNTRDVFVPASRSEDESGGDNDGRSLYEIAKDASFEGSTGEPNTPFETEPQLLDDKKELTDEAEKYITAGVRLDDVFDDDQVVSREYSRKSANNVMYDVVTYTMSDGKKIELVKDSAHTKELDAKYLSRYLNEDQIMTYYYLRGRFGKGEANDYLYNDLIPEAEDTDFYTLNVQRNKDFASEHPVITAAITPFTGAHNIVQEASNQVKSIAGKETTSRDTSASDAFSGRNQAVAESDLPSFLKLGAQAGLGALYNLPEMALGFVPGIGRGLSAAAGALSAMGDKRAQLRAEGNLDAEHATADILVAGIVGGLEWNALTKLVSSPASKLIGNVSGMKAVIGDVAKNALGAAGVGAAQQYLDSAMDQFFLQDESTFERTKQYYISQGMSEDEAHMQSFTENYVKPGINAALTGAVTGATYGLPNSIASGLQALPPAEIRANGNVNTVINFGLNAPENTYARVYAETLSAKRQQGTKITDEEISVQAGLNAIELNRRANLMRFEVNTSDDVPDSGQDRTGSDNSGQVRGAAEVEGPFVSRDTRDMSSDWDTVGDASAFDTVSRNAGADAQSGNDAASPDLSDASFYRAVRSAVDDYISGSFDETSLSDTARERFDRLKGAYADIAYKQFHADANADVADTNRVTDMVSGNADARAIDRLADVGDSMFSELGIDGFDSRALANAALEGYRANGSAVSKDTNGGVVYSSEDERYRNDSRPFQTNTGLETGILESFGELRDFDRERVERDIFNFTETAVSSFDRLLDVTGNGDNTNYTDAVLASYSELIEQAARNFSDVSDLFPTDDMPRKIAASALHGFIRDNTLPDASEIVSAADERFNTRYARDNGSESSDVSYTDFLRDLIHINVADIMYSDDVGVHMLYEELARRGVTDSAMDYDSVDVLFARLGEKYGTDMFDPDVYKSDAEKYRRIADYASELERSEAVRDTTPDIILGADVELFGEDIEGSFRNGLAKSEGDAVEFSNLVRDTLNKVLGGLRDAVDSSDFYKPISQPYDEYCSSVNDVIDRVTEGKGYSEDDKIEIADTMNSLVYNIGESRIRTVRARINDILSIYNSDAEIAGRKISNEAAEKAAGLKGMLDNYERDLVLKSGHPGSFNLTYEKYYTSDGKERTGTLRKEQVSGDAKQYYSRYQDMLVKADITNAETVTEAQKIIDKAKRSGRPDAEQSLLKELWGKHSLNHVDVATLILLVDEFDSNGRQTLAFEAGQCLARGLSRTGRTLQAAQIMRMMSPKAQLEYDIQLEYKRIDKVIDEFRDNSDEIRKEVEAARESDRIVAQKLEDEKARVYSEMREQTKAYNDLAERIKKTPPEQRGALEAELMSVKERIALKREYVTSLTSRYLDNADRVLETKKKLSDSFNKTSRDFTRREESLRREISQKRAELLSLTDEAGDLRDLSVSARVSVMALRSDISRLSSELAEARRRFSTASDEFKRMDKWLERLYRETLEMGDDVHIGFNEDAVLRKYNIEHIDRAVIEEARNLFTVIDTLVDNDELIEFIFGMSKRRGTGYGPHIRKMLENVGALADDSRAAMRYGAGKSDTDSKFGGAKALANIAKMQVHMWVKDQLPVSARQKLGTAQTISHLLNPRTGLNNIFSTSGFSKMETLTHNVGAMLDLMVGAVTGQRSVGFEIGFGQGVKNGLDRAQFAALGASLNIPLANSARTADARVTRRTFKFRPLAAAERALGYELTVPDEFYKGIAEQRTIDSLTRLGWSKEDIELIARQEADFRTFNDESALGKLLSDLKKAMNKRRIGKNKPGASEYVEFGLGDVVLKYSTVPGNVVQRTIEYTPLGYIKALYTVGSTLYNNHKYKRKLTPMEQREMILTIARPTTGMGVIFAGSLLFKLGVIVGTTFFDLEYNEDKYQEAKGLDGIQLNLSLLGRFAHGEFDTDLREGDVLIDLSNFQPFNELIELGGKLALLGADGDPFYSREALGEYLNVPFNVIGGLSMMQTISNAVRTFEETKDAKTAVGSVLADFAAGFIPGPLRHFGNLTDDYVRNPYKQDDIVQMTIDKALSKIPFLRESLPKSIDIWGNPRETGQGSLIADVIDAMISPYPLSVYSENEVNDEIDRLLEISKEILPTIPYESSSVSLDGVYYDIKLENEDYEAFSVLNGNIAYDSYRLMIDSFYYNQMPDSKRVEMLEDLSRESNTLAKQIWAARENGLRTEDEIQGMINEFMDDVRSRAAYETKTAQVLEAVTSDAISVEDALGSYAEVRVYVEDWSEDRVRDELAASDEDIYKLQTGNAWKKDEDGLWHQSKDWSSRTVETELDSEISWRNRIIDGTAYYEKLITGKWSELSPEEKEAIIDSVERNIKDMSLPESVIDHIPEYTLTLDGLKTQVSREKRQAAEEAARAAENGEAPAAEESAFVDDYESPDYGEPVQKKSYGRRYYSRGNRYSSYYPRRYYGGGYGNYGGGYYNNGYRSSGGRRLYASYSSGVGGRSRFYPTSGYVPSSGYSSGGSGYGYGGSDGAFPDPFAEIIFNAFPHIFDKLTGGR